MKSIQNQNQHQLFHPSQPKTNLKSYFKVKLETNYLNIEVADSYKYIHDNDNDEKCAGENRDAGDIERRVVASKVKLLS
jgi:hypothetical protein